MSEDRYVAGNPALAGTRSLIVLSGCSGGGKSSLIAELSTRGFGVRHEAGRQIVKEQRLIGGDGLPWQNIDRFVELTASRGAFQFNSVHPDEGPVFFDRSIIDVVSSYARAGRETPAHLREMLTRYRYHDTVFMAPPWPEIFATDSERQHGFDEAAAEYDWLQTAYAGLGYKIVEIPKRPISQRAEFVVRMIQEEG